VSDRIEKQNIFESGVLINPRAILAHRNGSTSACIDNLEAGALKRSLGWWRKREIRSRSSRHLEWAATSKLRRLEQTMALTWWNGRAEGNAGWILSVGQNQCAKPHIY
jgi:hypothetical protein